MEPFEYVIVLISLILGLGVAQLLNGLADMLAQFKKTKFSIAHCLFIIVISCVFFQDWWYTFQYSKEIQFWTEVKVLLLLGVPIILFLLARFMFPTGSRGQETDMVAYFYENWRWLYGLFTLTIIISIIQNLYISHYEIIEQIPLMFYLFCYVLFIVLNVKDMRYHVVFMIFQTLLWMYFLIGIDNGLLI